MPTAFAIGQGITSLRAISLDVMQECGFAPVVSAQQDFTRHFLASGGIGALARYMQTCALAGAGIA